MPIALVITDLDVGGAERALVALATRLDRERWSPAVVCLSGEGALAGKIRGAGLPCECLGASRRRPAQAIGRLARALRPHRPELVQSFLFHANIAARLAGPLVGWPWVIGGIRVAERRKRWHLMLDRLTAKLAAGSVCVSQGVHQFSVETAGLEPSRLAVIPNGIETAPYDEVSPVSRESLGIPREAYLALAVGRLDVQKGLPYLLAAAKRVVSERPDWHLALAGDGPERERLLREVGQDPLLTGHIHCLGHRDDIPGLLKTADLMVHASLWEGMPNAVLEAMAAARPVVATAVEGTDELVIPGETGWLVPPGDATALALDLLEAAGQPELGKSLGIAARRRVEKEYTLDRTVEAYEQLWARILGYRLPSLAHDAKFKH